MKRNNANQTEAKGTKQMTKTFIVDCVAKGNWNVVDNNGETIGEGFKNWTIAEEAARNAAIECGGTVVLMSYKTGEVLKHFAPKVGTPHPLKVARGERGPKAVVQTPEFGSTDVPVEDATPTEDELNALPTPALVAAYNAVGGSISGKYKGSRAKLVAKILAASAS